MSFSWFDVQVGEPEKIGSAFFHVRATDVEGAKLATKWYLTDEESPAIGILDIEPTIHDVTLNVETDAYYKRLGHFIQRDENDPECIILVRYVEDLRLPDKQYQPDIQSFFDDQDAQQRLF